MTNNPELFLLIFGEAVLNDAVSVVFFQSFSNHADTDEDKALDVVWAAGTDIIVTMVCSIFIGVALALMSTLVFKYLNPSRFPTIELVLFLLSALVPYYTADLLGFSGIMAVLFAGIVSDMYTFYHLSNLTRITIQSILEATSAVLEDFVFVYLGIAFFNHKMIDYSTQLTVVTLSCCLIGRAVSVCVLSLLANFFRKRPISLKYQVVMWVAGLRGPVAFALALIAPNLSALMVGTTLIVVFLTTVVLGGLTGVILSEFVWEEKEQNERTALMEEDSWNDRVSVRSKSNAHSEDA